MGSLTGSLSVVKKEHMAKTSKAPVKPIGRILYSEIYTWSPYGLGGESKYDRVCECKGGMIDNCGVCLNVRWGRMLK